MAMWLVVHGALGEGEPQKAGRGLWDRCFPPMPASEGKWVWRGQLGLQLLLSEVPGFGDSSV